MPVFGKVPVLRARPIFCRRRRQGEDFAGSASPLGAPGNGPARLGLTVSRKVETRGAQPRASPSPEIVRTHPELLCRGLDYVVVASPQAAGVDYATLREELTCLLEQARAWASHKSSS